MLGNVEVLYDDSKRYLDGGLSIGEKRNNLVQRATGKYLCFCDVDDLPAPNYIETLVRMAQGNSDVITFRNFTTTDFYWTVIDMRLGNNDEQSTPDKIVNRNCWHICPIKSEIAKRHRFPFINYSEDSEWMSSVLDDCYTEAHTDQILHSYRHSVKFSEADKIIKQHV
jgi:glycosyltransferase involved in cell wall biosynthesis